MSEAENPPISLVNAVLGSGCECSVSLDLEEIAQEMQDTSYEPNKLPAVVYSPHEADAKVMIFATGKLTCTGGGEVDSSKLLLQEVGEELEQIYTEYTSTDPVVNNLVATGELSDAIDLKIATVEIGMEHVEYEPEQFPAIVHRPYHLPNSPAPTNANPNAVVLLFASGKIVITGNTTVSGIEETYNRVSEELTTATRM